MATKRVPVSKKQDRRIRFGSGNVFADMQLPDADKLLAKSELALMISQLIDERKLTQKQAGTHLGLDQANVSRLVRGQLDDFSIDRLLKFLNILGRDVLITVKPHRQGELGVLSVLAKA